MSFLADIRDRPGGWPTQFTPGAEVVTLLEDRGLARASTVAGDACPEFLFSTTR